MVTKSDEYADPLPEGEEEEGLHAMLVVRCVGGRANAPWLQIQKSSRMRLSSPYTPNLLRQAQHFGFWEWVVKVASVRKMICFSVQTLCSGGFNGKLVAGSAEDTSMEYLYL